MKTNTKIIIRISVIAAILLCICALFCSCSAKKEKENVISELTFGGGWWKEPVNPYYNYSDKKGDRICFEKDGTFSLFYEQSSGRYTEIEGTYYVDPKSDTITLNCENGTVLTYEYYYSNFLGSVDFHFVDKKWESGGSVWDVN